MMEQKNFIQRNEGFSCENCGKQNQKAASSCRNHCQKCLFSKHVDEKIPGDRQSNCLGLMRPTAIDFDGKKGYLIIHECMDCSKEIRNMAAKDDNLETIIAIMKTQNTKPPQAKKHA